MTKEELVHLRNLRALATQGKWYVERRNEGGDSLVYCGGFPETGIGVWSTLRPNDTDLVCALVNAADELLEAAEACYVGEDNKTQVEDLRIQLLKAQERISDLEEHTNDLQAEVEFLARTADT